MVWANEGGNAHTVSSDDGLWESAVLRPGESFAVTFDRPGAYAYRCLVHGFGEMVGTIRVEE